MRNIFLFIRRFSVFIVFVILQIISLYLLFSYNRYHRAKGLDMAGAVTSFFNGKYNAFEDFITMKEENRRVHAMNDSLLNLLQQNFVPKDSGNTLVADSLIADTSGRVRQYVWRSAQVLYATVNSDKNYLQINKGHSSGIKTGMGVISSNGGLVGKVVNVGENFSQVMPLLNVMSKLSVKMKRTGSTGMLTWDGKQAGELTLSNIPKTDSAKRGDTILTGNYSLTYPPNKLVGTVARVLKDNSTNFLVLKIKPVANFGSLQQVFVVENKSFDEQQALDEDTRKILQSIKK
ncbi:MAG: rod shape-determining protein MreC [Niabella sp.]